MPSISDWLKGLGLERYASVFAEHEVDFDSLRLLTDSDLQGLGLALGPRRKLLNAIAELNGGAALATSAGIEALATPVAASAATTTANAGQRRQITVMFCDLVGSTALSQTLDPEDLREVMRSYQEVARSVIERYEGHIAQYLGDGIMVYFGWPRAHGDEARRAVRSGLEIIEAVARPEAPMKLAVRVGIATGLVVIGQTGEGDASQAKTAVGDTPNIAARLQALAQPNTIVIGPLTKTLARDAFEYQDLGSQALKGITEPVHAWIVVGVRAEATEHEDQADRAALVLVGRDEEIGLLQRAWQQSQDRHGRVVLVNGEPGIGKSALVESLLSQLREQGVPRITARCSAYHTSSALYPVIEHVKKVIGWQPEDASEGNLERLEQRLTSDGLPVEEFVPPLASLLSLPLPHERYAPLTLSPQQLKQRILDNLAEWQFTTVDRQPVVMIWEDLHWADPSTLEYLSLLIEQSPTTSLLMVLTFRPDFTPPWTTRSHLTSITLNRLERGQIEMLVRNLAKGKALPEEVLEHIVRKTDGVPLFVEELTKTILGSKVLRETDARFDLTGPLSAVAIPATLHESLMARLDRLPIAREVAQLGAVLGREFAYEVLLALGHGEEATLKDALSELVAGELLYQRGRPPRAKYTFKHALIRDAAYQSLLKRTRRQYHREVAQLLEARFPQQAETEPELLAYHYSGAEMTTEAIAYWLKAAERASSRSAYREALAHLDSGIAALEGLPVGRTRTHLELQLQVERATASQLTKGMLAKETTEAFSAAQELCKQLGEDVADIYTRVLWALAVSSTVRAELQRAIEVGKELLARGESAHDVPSVINAHRNLGFALVCSGDFSRGRSHLEKAVALYDYDAHHTLAAVYGQDPGVGSLAILSWALLPLGFPDQALARVREAVALAEKLAHPHSHAYALHYAAVVHLERGEYERSFSLSEAAMALATQHGFQIWGTLSKITIGEVQAALGRAEEGVMEIRRGITDLQATGTLLGWPNHCLGLARALKHAHRRDEALDMLNEALDTMDRTGERRTEANLYRFKGELLQLASPSDPAEPEACFKRALEIARAQGTKLWELRAATSLARLWQSQGKTKQARQLLAPIYNWFTEGFDTRDLQEAKALLEELP